MLFTVHATVKPHCVPNTLLCTTELVKSNDVEKSLRMVISFGGVNQKNFWSALEERLKPPMQQVSILSCPVVC